MLSFDHLIESPFTAIFITAVVTAIALTGRFSVTASQVLLFAAWLLALLGLRQQPWVIQIGSAAIVGGSLLLLGYYFRPDVIPGYAGVLVAKTVLSGADKKADRIIEIGNSGAKLNVGLIDLGDSKLKLEVINNKLNVSTQVRDQNGEMIAELIRNQWRVSPPKTWDMNYTDNALEVKDAAGKIVLQIVLLSDRVQLQGEWRSADGHGLRLVASKGGGSMIAFTKEYPIPLTAPEIQPIFLYPSNKYFGKLR